MQVKNFENQEKEQIQTHYIAKNDKSQTHVN